MLPRQTRVLHADQARPSEAVIAEAGAALRDGGLVVFPTETVYGLGANALDAAAVRRIFEAKGRPSTDPLIVHVTSVEDLPALVRHIPATVAPLAARFWPGALTLILPKRPEVPDEVTAGLDTVAVRVPSHPVARAIIAAAGCPVAAPSANRFSRPSPTDAAHVLADLDGRVDLVVDAGRTNIGLESTVLDLTVSPPLVRRPGGVSLEALRELLPDVQLASRVVHTGEAQVSPGQLLRHYAPKAHMTLLDGPADLVRARAVSMARAGLARGLRIGLLAPAEDLDALRRALVADTPALAMRSIGSRVEPDGIARELFDAIRALDAQRPDEIIAIGPEPRGIGLAVLDRLTRASEGRVIRCGPGTADSSGD